MTLEEMHKKFGSESDPNVQVEETETGVSHCFRITLGDKKVIVHARTLLDLSRKINLALLDWIAKRVWEMI